LNKGIAVTLTVAACLGYSAGAAAQDSTQGAAAPPAAPNAGPPPAADAAPAAAPAADSIETVTVTARRTAEDAQSVPVAITAFSADDLQREQINTGQDLQGRVPSLTISANSQLRNTELPTIRGQGSNFGAAPGVVIYMAEVPAQTESVTNGQGGPGKFFDLANVQVLKGSQGTLFGRNTTGGALLLEPHKPDNGFSYSGHVQGSNYSGMSGDGILNMPLIGDSLLMRLSAQYVSRGGFTKDVVTGQDYDNKRYWTSRLGLTWRPAEQVENYFLATYTYSRDNGTGTVIEGFNSHGINYGLLAEALPQLNAMPYAVAQATADAANVGCTYLNNGGIPGTPNSISSNCGADIVAAQQARGIRNVEIAGTPFDYLKTGSVTDQFKYELSDNLALRNIASFSILQHSFYWNFSGSRAQLDTITNDPGTKSTNGGQLTEELQLQGTALQHRLKFVVGGYYQNNHPIGHQEEDVTALYMVLTPEVYSIKQSSYAPYAQATYDLGGMLDALDGYKLTAGARYTTDRTEGYSTAGIGPHSASLSKSVPTWTVGLDKQFESNLVYGKVSRGYKAGGFLLAAANPADYTYKPEYVTNYEIGDKSDFHIGEAPARINTAVYYTNYTDMQRSGTDVYATNGQSISGGAIFTAGKAEISGVEIEGTVRPLKGLTLAANYSFTYAKYREYNLTNNGLNPAQDCSGQYIPTNNGFNTSSPVENLSCLPLQYTPKHQASITARYLLPMEVAGGNLDGSVSYSWTDKQYASSYEVEAAEPNVWLGSFGLLNANLDWSWALSDKSSLDLRFFGTNLADRKYRISNSNVWNTLYFQSSIYGEPRVFGLQLGYGWGQ
jgi:iron complex outermembrane receptor protein